MKYQFQIDGRAFGSPLRETWQEAAQDAVNKGYASWGDDNTIIIDGQAAIERIPE
jgi:hypothetical protein